MKKPDKPQEGDLKVWWEPQIPMKETFDVPVNSIKEAMLVLDTLAYYDLFQYEKNIKPDYCNMGGLQIYKDGEWGEWSDENGYFIDEIERNRE